MSEQPPGGFGSGQEQAFQLRLREDRPATIEEHRELRAEIARLRADNEALRVALKKARDDINDYGLDDFEETTHETLAAIDKALAPNAHRR